MHVKREEKQPKSFTLNDDKEVRDGGEDAQSGRSFDKA